MTEKCGYYPSANSQKAGVFGGDVQPEPIDSANNYGANYRAQLYVLCSVSNKGAVDVRYILTTPPGTTEFQPCEILFRSLKKNGPYTKLCYFEIKLKTPCSCS